MDSNKLLSNRIKKSLNKQGSHQSIKKILSLIRRNKLNRSDKNQMRIVAMAIELGYLDEELNILKEVYDATRYS